jgi:hypothetical protein
VLFDFVPFVLFCGTIQATEKEAPEMKVHWLTDADAALTEAKTQKKPLLIDFSAAPA